MVVASHCQGRGIGSKLLRFAESFAKDTGFTKIEIPARQEATAFYQKNDYQVEGGQFVEVTIPHYKMVKALQHTNPRKM